MGRDKNCLGFLMSVCPVSSQSGSAVDTTITELRRRKQEDPNSRPAWAKLARTYLKNKIKTKGFGV
jgi:hypothetical protein